MRHASAARHHTLGEIGHGGDEGLFHHRPSDRDCRCPDASGCHARDRIGTGDIPTTFREHGFALTYYSELRQSPGSLAVVLAPLARLGESWVWGAVGGLLGRTIARRWARPGVAEPQRIRLAA